MYLKINYFYTSVSKDSAKFLMPICRISVAVIRRVLNDDLRCHDDMSVTKKQLHNAHITVLKNNYLLLDFSMCSWESSPSLYGKKQLSALEY